MTKLTDRKADAYIKVKWWIIAITGVIVLVELVGSILGQFTVLVLFAVLLIAAISNLVAGFILAVKKTGLIHYILFFDLVLIMFALYFSGGMENSWSFLLGILIFIVGYQVSFRASLVYMALSLLLLISMFGLEYYRIIPHFAVYDVPDLYWTNTRYFVDYILGLFIFFGIAAVASGLINQVLIKSEQDKETRIKHENMIHRDLEASRKALLNVIEDLDRAKGGLEKRVNERTAELEDAKRNLEAKVKKRTEDLELSRKAILHMMQDLKLDVEKLRTVDRMKTQFLSVVSHELKTPLTPILEYTSLLRENVLGPTTEDQTKALEGIHRQSIHLKNLIENVLDVSRLETGKKQTVKMEPIALENILDEVEEAIFFDMKKMELSFKKDLDKEMPVFYADENAFRRVMINLIGNAIKFTPRKGTIKVSAHEKDGKIKICVSDTGIGIAKDKLDKVFDKFYQVDGSFTRGAPGMGMGLAICKGVIEGHGGRIWAESNGVGKGTTFCIVLPLGG